MGKVTIRTMSPLARMLAMAAAIFLLLCTTLHDSSAQTQPSSTAQPQKIEDLLKLLGDPEVQKWAATQKAGAPVLKPAATGQAFEPSFDAITERIRRHISDLVMTVPGFPAEIERATSAIGGELTGRGPLWMILLLATFLGAGFFMQWAVWRLSLTWRQWIAAARLGTGRERLIATSARLVFDAAHGLAFAIGSMAAFLLFEWPPFTSGIIVGYLLAAVMFWLARAVLEFLLSPSGARRSSDAERFRIIPMADGAATFWARRLAYAAGWFTFGWITVSLLAMLGFSLPSQQLIAYTLGIVLVAIAIEGIWRNPEKAESTAPSADRRLGRKTKNWLWSIYFAALWISWVVGAMRFFWFEVVAVGLPGAVLLTEKAVNKDRKSTRLNSSH